ncbi:MAG: Periplasmic beta-glucosidase [Candidatus Ordinivivax streblomastigis]|uniref:beta-glucosidase n=1 Tax=Candidatus Ordinivivax streblomastigis TaxID=2540710 RepID=A0A5M8P1F2_9BACT|nr:MAG: Periplasmic beta-glucosidase [Candidatus Ordinivivax streblomastigis]
MKQSLQLLIFGAIIIPVFFSCGTKSGNDSINQKVNNLLSKMTLEEKIGQMNQISGYGYNDDIAGQIKNGFIGSILNETDPETVNLLQKAAVEESRLGIPILFARDVIHGFKTIFPVPLGQASSWNPQVVENGGRVAAVEASSVGIRWTFAPMLDVSRDQRWGRIVESLGEDAYLTSVLGAAMIKGFQGDSLNDPASIAACAKHFAGYGAVEGGLDYNVAMISPEQLRNSYLPPFKAAAAAGAATFMVSFNEINGVPSSGNEYLVNQILRKEWGYNGLMVSDWNSIGEMLAHGNVKDLPEAAEVALKATVDMDMESHAFLPYLASLVKEGKVKEPALDEAVRRILKLKFQLGLFDNPYVAAGKEVFYAGDHLAKAKEAAVESVVLLKNENNLLPLSNKMKSVAVIGPMADAPHDQLGTWVFDGEKSHTVTPLAALRAEYGHQVRINYAQGLAFSRDLDTKQFAQAVSVARSSDVVLFFAGEEAILSGEAHSRADISLPGAQTELLKAIAKTGKPIALVVMAGRTIEIYKELPCVDAYLFTFHPGTMGGPALADLIFGKAVPSGKLPVTYPKMVGQTPIYYNHKNTGRPAGDHLPTIENIPLEAGQVSLGCSSYYLDAGKAPLFPFGYGLSYTTFEYSNLKLSATEITTKTSLQASCTVKNTGRRAGAEVVQLYIRDKVGSITRPVKELKAFDKITLQPDESKTLEFTLTAEELKFWNNNDQQLLEAGDYDLWIGPNSAEGLETHFVLK